MLWSSDVAFKVLKDITLMKRELNSCLQTTEKENRVTFWYSCIEYVEDAVNTMLGRS